MDPLELANEIENRYKRYLQTTFYFKDPVLRKSFEEALMSGHLRKGPYLETTPIFKRGKRPRDLFPDLTNMPLDEGFLSAVKGERHLYTHQEEAITQVVNGNNIVVATGTGSGKTEAFLYPILLNLYQEFVEGALEPGVRALILYPMNALANDQRERLGSICKELESTNSPFRFTFGQYIGETPEDEKDSARKANDHIANRLPGELVLRSEMRENPPHILLTNYSMLEYLLLRPKDSPFFDNGMAKWWRFLVLDEAHQYRGSRGIEMAMLLRRLKTRLREGGREGQFTCITTSATLMGGKTDRSVVARFATDLFDEQFQEENVILGETVHPTSQPSDKALSLGDYRILRNLLEEGKEDSANELMRMADHVGAVLDDSDSTTQKAESILAKDARIDALLRLISSTGYESNTHRRKELLDVQEVAQNVFSDLPEDEWLPALSELVDLLLHVESPEVNTPFISLRYHVLLRSLEGAFVSLWPDPKVILDRKVYEEGVKAFEVALCRECGQHYFVGKIKHNQFVEAIRDPGHPDFGATFLRPISHQSGEELTEDTDGKLYELCKRCGQIRRLGEYLTCDHDASIIVEVQEGTEEKEDQIPRCSACEYQAPDPVREVIHGTDGPHAVIATTMHQRLPQERRKVLAFADGRQQAAFFAWYLENTYKEILNRKLLLDASRRLKDHAPELSLKELAAVLYKIYMEDRILPASTGDIEARKEAWAGIYREFLTDELRISLEGVGLVKWSIKWPDWIKPPEVLLNPPWSLSTEEAFDLMFLLLDTMRYDKAVELRTDRGVSLNWPDLELKKAKQMRFRIGPPGKQWGVRSWDGVRGKRAMLLVKLLMQKGLERDEAKRIAVDTLREIWATIQEGEQQAPSSSERLLLTIDDARRLNPDWWRLRYIPEEEDIYQCDTCNRLQTVSTGGICRRHGCPGSIEPVNRKELELNHYRLLYQTDLPGAIRVEEHTAQLDKEKAREYQRDFKNGKIHVLSCSTTFELGVDLGDLDSIFLRNVPPEAFNYAQRVGRAGRRIGHPGFAVTFCRRGPHDLYHFAEPERMLSGKVRPPVLSLLNTKILTRHVAATALSFFFRQCPDRFNNVQSLVKDLTSPQGVNDFREFLIDNRQRIEGSLVSILPPAVREDIGLDDGHWIDRISGEAASPSDEARFLLAELELSNDYRTVKQLEEESSNKGDYKTADWAQKRALTIANEDVLSFLSRKAIIPKYGFPVDVVELDTQRTQGDQSAFEVSLQRDLSIAISEFAPTSKLLANKREWTSHGLKRVPEREWERRYYKRCLKHNVFIRWNRGEVEPPTPCGDNLPRYEYIIPRFGFVTDRSGPRIPSYRPIRVFTTRPYFVQSLSAESDEIAMPSRNPLVTVERTPSGLMVVLCEGRRGEGFYVCGRCGAGFRKRVPRHKTPQGQDCSGVLESVSLGHEFVTDVLRIQFLAEIKEEPLWFTYSLSYALLEGAAEVLEVPSNDLNVTVTHSGQFTLLPIVLYDNVPGGAGLVARLQDENIFRACLVSALARVDGNCKCGEDTSCYGCLRSYRNQFAHERLKRGPVKDFLRWVLGQWR